ncbi:MAG: hypothetical protein JO171_02235 [Paludibacterium sp.]|uniref:hypothetical protein n=1 Tax=Paludibacterium sp. TaxID=1917523 RepID=UPI0026012AA4|nr:hypothetical protein [Paludibacterium sp.]MBV8045943.1 hypothetical protein [Paludibacterium sp.]MBV8647889.1 hypothetical protein [Paludibacterium sp.]
MTVTIDIDDALYLQARRMADATMDDAMLFRMALQIFIQTQSAKHERAWDAEP